MNNLRLAQGAHGGVALASRIRHSIYIARALSQEGILRQYLGPVVFPVKSRPSWDPRSLRAEPGMDKSFPFTRLFGTEAALRVGSRFVGEGAAWQSWVATVTDTEMYARLDTRSDVLHWHTEALEWLPDRAQRAGMFLVADHRALHPRDEHSADWPRTIHNIGELERADLVIANSALAFASLVRHGLPPEKIRVITLGVNRWTGASPTRLYERPRRAIFVGALHRRKGLQYLAQAVGQCVELEELAIVGPVQDESLVRELLAANNSVKVYGRLSEPDVKSIMSNSRVLVLPSGTEAYGLVALEALSVGTPVVVSQGCGVATAVAEMAQRGSVYDPRDVNRLAELLDFYVSEPSSMVIDATGHYWEDYQTKIRGLYRDEILAETGRANSMETS